MDKDYDFKILYIAGAGRSGTTLLDIVIGNQAESFSIGELIHLIPNGIVDKEYCSCGQPLPDCELWSVIINDWKEQMTLSLEEYQNINYKYLRNKATLSWVFRFLFPDKSVKLFTADTVLLYQIIARHTGAKTLIDSSKNAQKILLLRKTGIPFRVLHLVRRFSHVLGSVQKNHKRDPEAGVEKDLPPFSTSYALGVWLADNFLSVLFSLGADRHHLRYENFIAQPEKVQQHLFDTDTKHEVLLKNRGPFIPEHLCAGSRIRMKDALHINKKPEKTQSVNSPFKRMWLKAVDFLF